MPISIKRSKPWLLGMLFSASAINGYAKEPLSVFACEPEWGALVNVLAPDAKVFNATTAYQDPHLVQARPSLIAKLRNADLAVCSGAALEVGWLPALQLKSANPKVQSNKPGLFFAADQVDTIEQHQHVDPKILSLTSSHRALRGQC